MTINRISKRGFGASIEAIAGSAGVACQTVYKVFGNKDRLSTEVVQALCHRLVPPVAADDTVPLPDFLSACGRHMIDLVIDARAVALKRISIGAFSHGSYRQTMAHTGGHASTILGRFPGFLRPPANIGGGRNGAA